MPPPPEDRFSIGADLLGTTIGENGVIQAQTGDAVASEVYGSGADWFQHVGLASRPSKAQPGAAAAQCVTINTGGNDAVIASCDARATAIYGNLKEGETCLYAGGPDGTGRGAVLIKGDGSVTLMTSDDNTAAGSGVYLKIAPDKLQFLAPWGTLTFDKTGFHVVTSTGARLDLGAMAAPGPLANLIPSYARLTAATVTIDSAAIMLGPSTGLYQSCVYATVPPASAGVPIMTPPIVVPAVGLVSAAPGSPVTGAAAAPPTPTTTAGSSRVFVGV